ncbi:MAG: amino acid ABC transporter permease [Desulfovibrio sp.]|jgi:L-cystine transport system permease protein|nr:amino acid ABC transporter permease [Desulfovibrio sp.]
MTLDIYFFGKAFISILGALPMTLLITVSAIILGFSIAVLLSYARYYKIPALCNFAAAYVSFFRGTPIMMHFFLVYYGLPHLIDPVAIFLGLDFRTSFIPLWGVAVIALQFSTSAYFAEILRAGISAVAKGEIEAGHALGMSHWQVMGRVILPQALSLSIHMLGSRCIAVMHSSSLAFWISVVEITGKANLVASDTYQFVEAFLAAALIYWIMTFFIERIVATLEKWNARALGRGLRAHG